MTFGIMKSFLFQDGLFKDAETLKKMEEPARPPKQKSPTPIADPTPQIPEEEVRFLNF